MGANKRTTNRKRCTHSLFPTNEGRAELRNSGGAGEDTKGSKVIKVLMGRLQLTMIQREIMHARTMPYPFSFSLKTKKSIRKPKLSS